LKQEGYETIIANNNPETVSTDFDTADRLYFEPLTPEDVENIVEKEKVDGQLFSLADRLRLNLQKPLWKWE